MRGRQSELSLEHSRKKRFLKNIGSFESVSWPLPHPLDFDWRFTIGTAEYLWNLARQLAKSSDQVILLGMTSLSTIAGKTSLWDGPITLLDRNARTGTMKPSGIRIIQNDILRDKLPNIKAPLVLADPPWYEAEMIGFLWSAASMCRSDGYVAVSIPPVGTRPEIGIERVRIDEAAARFGLLPFGLYPNILAYETPFFESNAFRAAGTSASREWRRGDLAIYTRNSNSVGARPANPPGPIWIERQLRGTRIRLQDGLVDEFEIPILKSIVTGDILPSVSRRDPRRANANVWTSGNRVFLCNGIRVLTLVIDALIEGEDPVDVVKSALSRELTDDEQQVIVVTSTQILNVVKCENGELQQHKRRLRASRKLAPAVDRPSALRRAG